MSGAPERNKFSVVASERKEVPPDGSQTDRNNFDFDDSDLSRLNFLSEVVRLLPASVTVQDEQGNFIPVNAAVAAALRAVTLFQMSSSVPSNSSVPHP